MGAAPDPLVLDLVQWVAREPRTYEEAIEAWRTTCPRLTVWEDAVEQRLVERRGREVVATAAGLRLLKLAGRARPVEWGRE